MPVLECNYYTPVHLQPYYRKLGFKQGDYPEAELYGTSAISLPLFPGLSSENQDRVITVLTTLLEDVLEGSDK